MSRRNFRTELARIDRFLAKGDDQSEYLWQVLSALRGPDVDNFWGRKKTAYTVPIRRVALPLCAKKADRLNSPIPAMFGNAGAIYHEPKREGHFYSHIRHAARVLGLKS